MGSQTQRCYDLGFNLRYLDKALISISIGDFTGYFSDAMPFAFRVKRTQVIAEDRLWGPKIQRHIQILKAGRSESITMPLEEFKLTWAKTLNENIIKSASEIARFRMGLIEQEEEEDVGLRVRRKQR